MDVIKANLRLIAFSAVVLACIGTAVWGYLGGSDIQTRLEVVQKIKDDASRARSGQKANRPIIEAKKKENAEQKLRVDEAENVLLAVQRTNYFYEPNSAFRLRKPLEANVLPAVVSPGDAFRFQKVYKEEFMKLREKLRSADRPTADDIQIVQQRLDQTKKRPSRTVNEPWSIAALLGDLTGGSTGPLTKLEALRANAESVAAYEKVMPPKVYMYADLDLKEPDTFARHRLALSESAPTAVDIWQAQMALWIQQDMAAALTASNEERATQLRAASREQDCWVAYLPVKHFKRLSIADALGAGGGSNKPTGGFANSLTGRQNNPDYFVVPLQLSLVVEQAELPRIIEKICAIGFYTPLNVSYSEVRPNPTQTGYIYGSDPVIDVVIDLEGVYFRKVFNDWIPERPVNLKQALSTPGGGSQEGGAGAGGVRFGRG